LLFAFICLKTQCYIGSTYFAIKTLLPHLTYLDVAQHSDDLFNPVKMKTLWLKK